ncbi:MAG: VanZ family protein [Lachnospiraceae bacterium]|nr:VanZ family protein [Lachnospiraceae bacterium]
MKNIVESRYRIAAVVVYIVYLIFLGYLLFFSQEFGRISEGRVYSYNFIPFKEILRYIVRANTIGAGPVAVNLLGNIAAFIPMGTCVPVISPRLFGHPYKMLVMGAFNSASIEVLQLVTGVGSCDIDDVILNTTGVILGYFLVVGFVHREETADAV